MSDGVHENRGHVLGLLASIGLDSKKFDLQNLLPGGASAGTNIGVNIRLFEKHVRWVSQGQLRSRMHAFIYKQCIYTTQPQCYLTF